MWIDFWQLVTMFPEIEKWFSTLNSGFTLLECRIKKKKKKKPTQNSSHQVVLRLFLLVVYISWFVYFIVECKPFFLTVVVRFRPFAKWSRLWRIRKGNASWGSVSLAGSQGKTWGWRCFQGFKNIRASLCFTVVLHHHLLADRLSFLFTRSSNALCDISVNPSFTLTWRSWLGRI